MANNYINRTVVSGYNMNSLIDITQNKLRNNFRNMLNNVTNMLNNEGPIMSTWIKFQIGADVPIIFDNSSTNPKQNLIAQLNYNKTGAGVTNDFTITIQYDPFNMGQETADVIERLDAYVADAMSMNFNSETKKLQGRIQYGYNAHSDASLVSPEYQFYLTNANTTVRMDSGISTYEFSGTSILSVDCDNIVNFSAVQDDTLKVVEYVMRVLYEWYGDSSNPPRLGNYEGITVKDNEYKYNIEASEDCFNGSAVGVNISASDSVTPWAYCENILKNNPLSESEKSMPEYQDEKFAELSYAERPRYVLNVVDSTNTIYISHQVPNYKKVNGVYVKSELSLDHTFEWGTINQKQSVVIGWKPEVDTYFYLVRRALYKNMKSQYDAVLNSKDDKLIEQKKAQLEAVNDELNELFNAQLQIIGIPADPPLNMELGIKPRILETTSRTSGIYIVTGCTDTINSNGVYMSTLKLFRIRGLDDIALTSDEIAKQQEEQLRQQRIEYLESLTPVEESEPQSGGGSGGGRRRSLVDRRIVYGNCK